MAGETTTTTNQQSREPDPRSNAPKDNISGKGEALTLILPLRIPKGELLSRAAYDEVMQA